MNPYQSPEPEFPESGPNFFDTDWLTTAFLFLALGPFAIGLVYVVDWIGRSRGWKLASHSMKHSWLINAVFYLAWGAWFLFIMLIVCSAGVTAWNRISRSL